MGTIKHHFGGDQEAAMEIIMQSVPGADIVHSEDCMTLCLFPCRFVAQPAFGFLLHKVFPALTVPGTFPYAEREVRRDQICPTSS